MPHALTAIEKQVAELRGSFSGIDQIAEIRQSLSETNRRLNELRLTLRGHAIPPQELWDRRDQVATDDGPLPLNSTLCRQRDFDRRYFREWLKRYDEPLRYHRGLWEWVYVGQALSERGVLGPGQRGIGFGIGREAMPATFAALGCKILATDLAPEEAAERGWVGGVQYGGALEKLRRPRLCPEDLFTSSVEFRSVDMRNIPSDLTGFDFCWSCCALEHLGSLEAGTSFIERSLDTLRPGGVAVHTTELNLSSDSETIETGPVVFYRRCDFEALAERLTRLGHEVAPLDLSPGDQVLDRFVDLPPYERSEPHIVLAVMGVASTSAGLIIRKGGAA